MARSRFFRLHFLLAALLALAIGICLSRGFVLALVGRALVADEGPASADVAVVLGGGYDGARMIRAAELVRQGYVRKVVVSGPMLLYGVAESDLAIPWTVARGYPAEWFEAATHDAHSTRDEAGILLPLLAARGVRSLLLVTSNYHTGRAARTFRAVSRRLRLPVAMRVVAAPDRDFPGPNPWWLGRDGQKTVLLETAKSLAYWFGI